MQEGTAENPAPIERPYYTGVATRVGRQNLRNEAYQAFVFNVSNGPVRRRAVRPDEFCCGKRRASQWFVQL